MFWFVVLAVLLLIAYFGWNQQRDGSLHQPTPHEQVYYRDEPLDERQVWALSSSA